MMNNSNKEREALNNDRSKGLNIFEKKPDGKWMTVWCTPEEVTGIVMLKSKWNEMGIKLREDWFKNQKKKEKGELVRGGLQIYDGTDFQKKTNKRY